MLALSGVAGGQTILGKHPFDTFAPGFWTTTNANADKIIDALNKHGTLGLTNTAFFPYLPSNNITFTTNGDGTISISASGGGSLPPSVPARIIVYNGSSNATPTTMTGDLSISPTGVTSLANNLTARGHLGSGGLVDANTWSSINNFTGAIQQAGVNIPFFLSGSGTPVGSVNGLSTWQYLDTAGSNFWVYTGGSLGNTAWTKVGPGAGLPAGTPAQMVVYNAASIGLAATLSGDATINTNGALTLAASGVAAGMAVKVTVDAKGRVTGTNVLLAADIPNLAGTIITSGTVGDSFLSANVELLNGAQTVSGNKLFTGGFGVTGTSSNNNLRLTNTFQWLLQTNNPGFLLGVDANGIVAPTNAFSGNFITSGTVADARLSGNVPLLNAVQTWSGGSNIFSNPAYFNGGFFGNAATLNIAQNANIGSLVVTNGFFWDISKATNAIAESLSNSVTGLHLDISTNASLNAVGLNFHFGTNNTELGNTNFFSAGSSQTTQTNTGSLTLGQNVTTVSNFQALVIALGTTQSSKTNAIILATTNTALTISSAGSDFTGNLTKGGVALLTGNQSITVTGDVSGSGTTAITTTLANSGVTAGSFVKGTTDAKGRVTGTNVLLDADIPAQELRTNGSGAGLTSLSGTQVTTGTVADARLSANVALLNGNGQTFTGNSNSFQTVYVTNLTAVASDPNSPTMVFSGSYITIPSFPSFLWFFNGGHTGGGEMQMAAPNFYIGPANGGHIQLGLGSDTRDCIFVQYAADPANHSGYSQLFGWRYNWATNTVISRWDSAATNYDNTLGASTLDFWVDATNDWANDADLSHSHKVFSLDSRGSGAVQIHGGTTYDVASASPSSTYTVNFTGSQQNVLSLAQAVTFSLININLTNQSHPVELFIYPGLSQKQVTFPAGLLWSSESGLAVAPTNSPGSNILHVIITPVYGTVTNTFAHYDLAPYQPVLDTNASNFFVASGISDGLTKDAINNFVINAKAHGYWTKLLAFYPMVGGNSNTCSWNLVATNNYRMAWNGGGLTFASTGVTGDGTASYGDTQLVPSTQLASSTNSFAGINVRGPATPTDLGYFFGANAADNKRWGLWRNGANWQTAGMNANTIGDVVTGASSDFRGYMSEDRVGTSIEYDTFKSGAPVANNPTPTAVNGLPTLSCYVLARNDTGADRWSNAEVNNLAIGSAFTVQNLNDLQTDEAALNSALGR